MRGLTPTLTSTSDRVHDLRRMPGTDTGNLAETLVRLTGKFLGTPTVGDTFETVTLRDGNNIDTFILLENGLDIDRLLE